ncbi:MAG: HAD-IB family phosphatase [Verrucomicrobiota bacterium JB023]|nr:HAD-IB family phosphatase [Verrucomicrobiota bacterium JB023]
MTEKSSGWALFDLDQTIVPWDMQLLFCNFVLQREGWRRVLLVPFLLLTPFAKLLGAETMKRVFVGFCYGLPRKRLEGYAREFAEEAVNIAYGDVVAEIERQKQEGRTTVLASASPEIYVREIGDRLGFDHSFGTEVAWQEKAPWFPRFPRGNHKGANKVTRLREELGLEGVLPDSEGYSDSKADLPMLAMCERVVAVHPEGIFAEKAAENHWRVLSPDKPWQDRRAFALASIRMILGIYR